MKTAKEILDELKAREELRARGWTQTACRHCNGTGMRSSTGFWVQQCYWCDGTGKLEWKGPITK